MSKGKRATRRMKDLSSKKLSERQAKGVRGGVGMLLPAIQKVRGASLDSQACDAGSKDAAKL
jgi:hypothetical protein